MIQGTGSSINDLAIASSQWKSMTKGDFYTRTWPSEPPVATWKHKERENEKRQSFLVSKL